MNLTAIMRDQDRSLRGAAIRAGLAALTPGYAAAVAARNGLFDKGLRHSVRLGRPVISVGNLTTGGTGKTPMVIDLARRLIAMGTHPAVLLRGYRGKQSQAAENKGLPPAPRMASDEQELYIQALGNDVPVAADPDRGRSARYVLARWPQTDVILLDDGFQHRQVHRDLDLVLIDASDPFGHNHLLPRGFLREPKRNLRRADGVIVTRADHLAGPEQLAELDREIERWHGRASLAHAAHRWTELRDGSGGAVTLEVLKKKRVMGVCGIGNPLAFAAMLRQATGVEVELIALADHYEYQPADLVRIAAQAKASGADAVVTTEKDYVKWAVLNAGGKGTNNSEAAVELIAGFSVPIYRPVLEIEFLDGAAALDAALRQALTD